LSLEVLVENLEQGSGRRSERKWKQKLLSCLR